MLTTPASWGYVLWTHRGGGICSAGALWLGLGTVLRAMRRGGGPCAVCFVGWEVVAMLHLGYWRE